MCFCRDLQRSVHRELGGSGDCPCPALAGWRLPIGTVHVGGVYLDGVLGPFAPLLLPDPVGKDTEHNAGVTEWANRSDFTHKLIAALRMGCKGHNDECPKTPAWSGGVRNTGRKSLHPHR